jgi:Ca-activated chloride channel family protein
MTDSLPFGFSFAHPWVLLLLLLLPVLAILKGRFGGTAGITFSTTSTLAKLGQRRRSRAGALLALLAHLALGTFIVGLARPQLGRTFTRVQASGVDIMLVLDVSRSMLAEDFSIGSQRANRLEAVKQVTERFIRQRPNDRIGITAFAGRPYLVSPLTLDHDWLIKNLERLQIGMVEDGTAIGSATAAAANRFKDKTTKTKLIVLLSDGDNNAGRVTPITAAEAAKALGIRIYTIGAGTNGKAVPFPFQDPFGRTVYRNIEMQFDEATLKQIASLTKGQYFYAGDTDALEKTFSEIDKMEKTKVEVEKTSDYRDLFQWFLAAGFGLLTLEALLSQTVWKRLP